MKLRPAFAAMLVALLGALLLAPSATLAASKESKFLKNVKVSGTLEDGRAFKGNVTITEFGYDPVLGLTVDGLLTGTVTNADKTEVAITQRFNDVAATLNESATLSGFDFQAQATCSILTLDIGRIFLDLLGLQVDLAPISLDITAVSGAGNLLGNLLCAVAGLLDPNGLLDPLIGTLEDLLGLLNQINAII